MGEARVEQTKRQTDNTPDPKAQRQLAKIGRRNARRVARSHRRGYFGLARAIAGVS